MGDTDKRANPPGSPDGSVEARIAEWERFARRDTTNRGYELTRTEVDTAVALMRDLAARAEQAEGSLDLLRSFLSHQEDAGAPSTHPAKLPVGRVIGLVNDLRAELAEAEKQRDAAVADAEAAGRLVENLTRERDQLAMAPERDAALAAQNARAVEAFQRLRCRIWTKMSDDADARDPVHPTAVLGMVLAWVDEEIKLAMGYTITVSGADSISPETASALHEVAQAALRAAHPAAEPAPVANGVRYLSPTETREMDPPYPPEPGEPAPAAQVRGDEMLRLFHVQDADRPMYVVARDWSHALDAWWQMVRAENPGEDIEEMEGPDGISAVARAVPPIPVDEGRIRRLASNIRSSGVIDESRVVESQIPESARKELRAFVNQHGGEPDGQTRAIVIMARAFLGADGS